MATSNDTSSESTGTPRRTGILSVDFEPTTVTSGVHVVATQGNGVVVEQQEGLVVVDAGPGGDVTDRMLQQVRGLSDDAIATIVYSHGHIGYNAGVPQWRAHAEARGDREPERLAHANVAARLDRYRKTHRLQLLLNQWQFPRSGIESLEAGLRIEPPTRVFHDRVTLDDPERPIEVLWAPSETDDSIALWLPEQQILYSGPAVISAIPNIGTPLRTQRFTQRWIDTLERLRSLGATTLIPEFGDLVHGEAAVERRLTLNIDALRWIRDETIERLERGMTDVEIIHDIQYPAALFGHAELAPTYGCPDYIVRDVVREQTGWWSRANPTDLHPEHPDAVATALLEVVDPDAVLSAARRHRDAGDLQLALHVIDLIALARVDDERVVGARALKAELCEQLARQTDPFVSRSLYFGFARLYRSGGVRWSDAPDGLDRVRPADPSPSPPPGDPVDDPAVDRAIRDAIDPP